MGEKNSTTCYKKIFSSFLIVFACSTAFYICSEPFRNFLRLSDVTEVKPACALPMAFGIAFGFWGSLGASIGNLLGEIKHGYPPIIWMFNFLITLASGFLPALIWNSLRKKDSENRFRLERVYKVVQFQVICITDGIIFTFLTSMVLKITLDFPFISLINLNTLLNQFIFLTIVGTPCLIVCAFLKQMKINRITGKKYTSISMNEKFILFFLMLAIFVACLNGASTYFSIKNQYAGMRIEFWYRIYLVVGLSLLFFLVPALIVLYYIEQNITKPVERMSEAVNSFGSEKDIKLEIAKIQAKCEKYLKLKSEVGNLARSYYGMTSELEEYINNLKKITSEREKSETQLKIATSIQVGALPKLIFMDSVDLFAFMLPAMEVGGDFYDFYKIDEDHLALTIADVSGKGVPAALFMMIAKLIIQKHLKTTRSPAQALAAANNDLFENNAEEMFVTCLCGILNLKTNELTFASAGHNHPAICRKGKEYTLSNYKNGFVLGSFPNKNYEDYKVQLEKGDAVFAYTDGITESKNPDNEEFGANRMLSILNESQQKSLPEICGDMRSAIKKFNDKAPQFDDITMLLFRIK